MRRVIITSSLSFFCKFSLRIRPLLTFIVGTSFSFWVFFFSCPLLSSVSFLQVVLDVAGNVASILDVFKHQNGLIGAQNSRF